MWCTFSVCLDATRKLLIRKGNHFFFSLLL